MCSRRSRFPVPLPGGVPGGTSVLRGEGSLWTGTSVPGRHWGRGVEQFLVLDCMNGRQKTDPGTFVPGENRKWFQRVSGAGPCLGHTTPVCLSTSGARRRWET